MADAPPWPNLVFNCIILYCPIIIWLLLLAFPYAFANLVHCHYRSGRTLLHQQSQILPRHHHPSRKKKKFMHPPPLQHLRFCPKCVAIIFAVAWFIYKLGCNLESFGQQAKKATFGYKQGICAIHKARVAALQSVHQINCLTSVRCDSDLYLMGVDGHASYCMANNSDQFDDDLKLIDGDHQVDGIGSGIAIKGMGPIQVQVGG